MTYPYLTLNDETEIVHSEIFEDQTVKELFKASPGFALGEAYCLVGINFFPPSINKMPQNAFWF